MTPTAGPAAGGIRSALAQLHHSLRLGNPPVEDAEETSRPAGGGRRRRSRRSTSRAWGADRGVGVAVAFAAGGPLRIKTHFSAQISPVKCRRWDDSDCGSGCRWNSQCVGAAAPLPPIGKPARRRRGGNQQASGRRRAKTLSQERRAAR